MFSFHKNNYSKLNSTESNIEHVKSNNIDSLNEDDELKTRYKIFDCPNEISPIKSCEHRDENERYNGKQRFSNVMFIKFCALLSILYLALQFYNANLENNSEANIKNISKQLISKNENSSQMGKKFHDEEPISKQNPSIDFYEDEQDFLKDQQDSIGSIITDKATKDTNIEQKTTDINKDQQDILKDQQDSIGSIITNKTTKDTNVEQKTNGINQDQQDTSGDQKDSRGSITTDKATKSTYINQINNNSFIRNYVEDRKNHSNITDKSTKGTNINIENNDFIEDQLNSIESTIINKPAKDTNIKEKFNKIVKDQHDLVIDPVVLDEDKYIDIANNESIKGQDSISTIVNNNSEFIEHSKFDDVHNLKNIQRFIAKNYTGLEKLRFYENFNYFNQKSPSECMPCDSNTTLGIEPRMIIKTKNEKNCALMSHSYLLKNKYCHNSHASNHNIKAQKFRLLISCTGRSGSTFLFSLLNHLGFRIAHDSGPPHGYGAVAWPWNFNEADKVQINMINGKQRLTKCGHHNNLNTYYHTLIHLVRDPLKSIKSRWDMGKSEINHLRKQFSWLAKTDCFSNMWTGWPINMQVFHQPRKQGPDLISLVSTIRHWIYWNTFAKATAKWNFRLEDITNELFAPIIIQKICYEMNKAKSFKNCPNEEKIKMKVRKLNNPKFFFSNHTKKFSGWNLNYQHCFQADPYGTVMLQLMALNYGYDIPVGDIVPPLFDHFCKTVLGKNNNVVQCKFDNIPEPTCSLNKISLKWGCKIPSEIPFDLSKYPLPKFPFSMKKYLNRKHSNQQNKTVI